MQHICIQLIVRKLEVLMRYENVLCVRLADDELRDRRTCEK